MSWGLDPQAPIYTHLGYQYDALHRQTYVVGSTGIGNVPVYANGWEYNDQNQLTRITQGGPDLTEKRIDLTYTPTGQLDRIDRFEVHGTQTYSVATSDYTYDELDRLREINSAQRIQASTPVVDGRSRFHRPEAGKGS